jgi:RNA 2',3'-cyclic 3'-phosphodiesterase
LDTKSPANRLFVAVWPPGPVVDAIASITGKAQPERWHVTLRFIGPGDPSAIAAELQDVQVVAPLVVAGPAVERLGRGVVSIPVAGLTELAEAVGYDERRPFHGHITLARLRDRSQRSPLIGEPFAAEWTVEEFTLVSSQLHPKSAQYTVLERFSI